MRVTVVRLGKGLESRLQGWARADGEVVAFLDTRYRTGSEWMEVLGTAPVVGGHVLPDAGYDWAGWLYYVIEYGWKERLAVGNVAYRRAEVVEIDEFDPGAGVHDARMDVVLSEPPSFAEYVRERYSVSRRWGARHVSPGAALLRVALPLVVLARTPWWRKPLTLPGVLVMSVVMAWGEMAGSWFGASGKVKAG